MAVSWIRVILALILLVAGTVTGALLAKYWLKWPKAGVIAGAATGAFGAIAVLVVANKAGLIPM